MTLTRQDILDYAARYVAPEAVIEFPFNGDLFCLLSRELPEGKILTDEEGWQFQGYGICAGYLLDDEAKPPGKWLWMHFASLAAFPPAPQVLKLQPPHVVKGRFLDPSRTREFRIIKLGIGGATAPGNGPATALNTRAPAAGDGSHAKNIVRFRKKKSGGKPSVA